MDSAFMGQSTPTTAFLEHFDTLPIQYRHIEHMHEGVLLIFLDKMTALRSIFSLYGFCICIDSAFVG